MHRFVFLFLFLRIAEAQPQLEIQEFTGTVKKIEPGFGLAYERLVLDVSGSEEAFIFQPEYGEFILNNIKPGDKISLQAKVNISVRKNLKSMSKENKQMWSRDLITAIKLNNEWKETPEIKYDQDKYNGGPARMFFDIEVKEIAVFDGHNIGLVFDDGMVAYNWYQQTKEIKKGDVISFSGFRFAKNNGYAYPVSNVKKVYFFNQVFKEKGELKSFLYKQNFVCIGIVIKAGKKEIKVSFPSNFAERILQFFGENKKVIVYFDDYQLKGQLHPTELRALVRDGDTLRIEQYGFYGGADIKHEHKPATIKGNITHVNRNDNGRIMNIIVGNDCYVELDPNIEKQIGNFFNKGREVEISGDERIKAKGEIYSKSYRIIIPRSLSIAGKTFLVGQQP